MINGYVIVLFLSHIAGKLNIINLHLRGKKNKTLADMANDMNALMINLVRYSCFKNRF